MTSAPARGLTADDLLAGWRRSGVEDGMHVVVHSSLAALGPVNGGAATVADSLCRAVGARGTIVVPTFTPQVRDPGDHLTPAPYFTADLPSPMGAVAEAVRTLPGAVRSRHPQASVAAVGASAREIVADQPWHFAVGPGSPFDRLVELDGRILLVGVGHNRNSSLHHAETFTAHRRLKVRRFPVLVDGERTWEETMDVGDDNDTHFPVVGQEFEAQAAIEPVRVGAARVVLLPAREFRDFATRRLDELLGAER